MWYAILGAVLLLGAAAYVRLARKFAVLRQRSGPAFDLDAEIARTQGELERLRRERQQLEEEGAQRTAQLNREHGDAKALYESLGPAVDATAEVQALKEQAAALRSRQARLEEASRERRMELERAYAAAKAVHDRLAREVSLLEENIEDISFGLYRPHYDFTTTAEYKAKLDEITSRMKRLVHDDAAFKCEVEWTVGGSRRDGERMQRQYGKLMLRAFNGECDAALAKVAWNNVTRMEQRIRQALISINELGHVMKVSITPAYGDLRMEELRLEHEFAEKKRAEVEEQRRIREQMREEEKAQRELEQAQREAEAEEVRYQRALDKARAELELAMGSERAALSSRVEQLQRELEEAHAKKERAISQAQLTKLGHVYVISNIGSFGTDVVKIGMTRRLDPMDRVRELGDASVPFSFDVHGLVRSEDAPALEYALHKEFEDRRVNLMNYRKEFYRVELSEIAKFVEARKLTLELTMLAEAREYRQSIALRLKQGEGPAPQVGGESPAVPFPEAIF